MTVIYLDCFAGVSGNMLLGALLDAGLPEERLRSELAKLPIAGYELRVKRVVKCGISAVYVDVQTEHHHHHHRHLPDILTIIDNSTLDQKVKEDSKRVFWRLAEAEAKVHGTAVDAIHFHEVGAVDAIVDIVGVVFGLHYLGVDKIYTSKIHVGNGFIQCSHGRMPVPAPATAELLRDIPFYSGDVAKELTTPTGAALIATLGAGYGGMPQGFVSEKIAYGAGTWELDIPNVVRMFLGKIKPETEPASLIIMEANIDDLNPQIYHHVMNELLAKGALDVWLTPIIMKKGRPATKLSLLVDRKQQDAVLEVLFTETSTLGVRYYPVERETAERCFATVELPWGQVAVKIGSYRGQVCNIAPEYEDCLRLARQQHIPLKDIQQAAIAKANEKIAKKGEP